MDADSLVRHEALAILSQALEDVRMMGLGLLNNQRSLVHNHAVLVLQPIAIQRPDELGLGCVRRHAVQANLVTSSEGQLVVSYVAISFDNPNLRGVDDQQLGFELQVGRHDLAGVGALVPPLDGLNDQ